MADGEAVASCLVFFAEQAKRFPPDLGDALAADFAERIEALHVVLASHDLAAGENGHA